MTADEVKLVVSLARDPSYQVPDWASAVTTRQWLLTALNISGDTYSSYHVEDVHDSDYVYLSIEDLVVFLREYCLYDDLSPNHGPLSQWLKLLGSNAIQLAELTPESWNNLLTAKVIQKMNT